MIIALLILLLPSAIYIASYPASRWLEPTVRKAYRGLSGIIVFCGSSVSLYLAAYNGDQGGVGAYLFQLIVISSYVVLSLSLIVLNIFHRKKLQAGKALSPIKE